MVVDIFWRVVGGGEYILAGGGLWWVMVDILAGGGWWHSLVWNKSEIVNNPKIIFFSWIYIKN